MSVKNRRILMNALLKKIESDYLKEEIENVEVGDSVKVGVKIIEGSKERIQKFDGIVISIKGNGLNKNITVRKISFGIGVEKTIPLHSPRVASIEIVKKAKVRRAKLYFLRDREGRQATKLKSR